MGGVESAAASHSQTNYCHELQDKLLENRQNNVVDSLYRHESLPRSTKVDGRFILTKEDFPDYIDYGSLSDLYKWKTECDPHEQYTEEYLRENLPVVKPDSDVLRRGILLLFLSCYCSRSIKSYYSNNLVGSFICADSVGWLECSH